MSQVEAPFQMMIVKLQQHFPLRVTDWLLGGILTTWGLVCLSLPASSWELTTYAGLRPLASQMQWGIVALGIGFARMIALFVNGALRRTPHLRGVGAFLSVFIWLQLSFALFNTEIATIGIAIYPWLFLADIYNVYRASQDARDSDMRWKALQQRKTEDAVCP